jgi:sigma-B regulation protein RsbU (phosphoserine phosphatase)
MAEYSILVVEDEHTLRRLLEYKLGKQFRVRSAENGIEALRLLDEEVPDLIISDIMMPKMDGFTLQAAVQERPETRATPFIFLTAKADEGSQLKGRRTGVDDYITKPFDIDQLTSRVQRLLERTKIFRNQLDARIGEDFSRKLMPKSLPNVEGYRTIFYNQPREHGGGDIFDWTEIRPGTYFITVGDVMGKGLQAKFYAFSFLGYIRSTLHTMMKSTESPAELIRRVNQTLIDDPPLEDTFASLLVMRWEPAKNELVYANAGHCRPVVSRPGGADIATYSDIILGLDYAAEFKDTLLQLEPGSSVVAYTDGILEQVMSNGEQLGEEGLIERVSGVAGTDEPVDNMLHDVLRNSQQPSFADDVLVFWLERLATVPDAPSNVDLEPGYNAYREQTPLEPVEYSASRNRPGRVPSPNERSAPKWFSPFKDIRDQ